MSSLAGRGPRTHQNRLSPRSFLNIFPSHGNSCEFLLFCVSRFVSCNQRQPLAHRQPAGAQATGPHGSHVPLQPHQHRAASQTAGIRTGNVQVCSQLCMRTGNISATDYMLAHRLPAAALTPVSAQTPCRPRRAHAERAPHRQLASSQAFIVSNKLEQSHAVSSNLDRPQPRHSTDLTYDSLEQARLGTYFASPIPKMLHIAHVYIIGFAVDTHNH